MLANGPFISTYQPSYIAYEKITMGECYIQKKNGYFTLKSYESLGPFGYR